MVDHEIHQGVVICNLGIQEFLYELNHSDPTTREAVVFGNEYHFSVQCPQSNIFENGGVTTRQFYCNELKFKHALFVTHGFSHNSDN